MTPEEQASLDQWIQAQPQPGSFLAVGKLSDAASILTTRGWRGAWIVPWPSEAAVSWASGVQVGVINARLTNTSQRLIPVAPGIVTAALHPSELFELWDGLPQPRFASVLMGAESADVYLALRDWVELDACEVELPADEPKLRHLRDALGPWQTVNLTPAAQTALAYRPHRP